MDAMIFKKLSNTFAEVIHLSYSLVIYIIMNGCFQCPTANSEFQRTVNSGYCKSAKQRVYVAQVMTNASG